MTNTEIEDLLKDLARSFLTQNDMFGELLKQHKQLLDSLKLVAVSLNNLQDRMAAMEKLNSINTN